MLVPHKQSIFLVGPMGVGKTTIGKMLAHELDLTFIDSDHEIEHRAGADIAWIFDQEGEPGFRSREAVVIEDLTAQAGILLATGGGSVLNPENRRFLMSRGIVVHLDTSLDLQIKRTAKDKRRPLLQGVDHTKVLTQLKDQRDPIYRSVADITCVVGEESSKKVVNNILRQLKQASLLTE
ncbi:MAG: shikimate kinase [Candidatus Azotimanducaceae bacterium]|jgi:shikimate kinase